MYGMEKGVGVHFQHGIRKKNAKKWILLNNPLFNNVCTGLKSPWMKFIHIKDKKKSNKLGLSCAKLKIVELKIEDKTISGLNENWGE